jgi:hypothetical protein
MVFATIDTLEPARVGWNMLPEESTRFFEELISKQFEMSTTMPRPPDKLSLSRKFMVTTEEVVARWCRTGISEGDALKALATLGPGKMHRIYRVVATEFALEALKGVAADIYLANVYGWGVFDKAQLFRCSSSGKLYRMSADTALGSNRIGTEPLNHDRSETWANLGFLTFGAAAHDLPYFRFGWEPNFRTMSQSSVTLTYSGHTNSQLLPSVDEQFEALSQLVQQKNVEMDRIFAFLPIPGDVHRVAALYPDEAGWMASIEGREFWQSFVHDRLRYARRCFRSPHIHPITPWSAPWSDVRLKKSDQAEIDGRFGSYMGYAKLWSGYNTGVRAARRYVLGSGFIMLLEEERDEKERKGGKKKS